MLYTSLYKHQLVWQLGSKAVLLTTSELRMLSPSKTMPRRIPSSSCVSPLGPRHKDELLAEAAVPRAPALHLASLHIQACEQLQHTSQQSSGVTARQRICGLPADIPDSSQSASVNSQLCCIAAIPVTCLALEDVTLLRVSVSGFPTRYVHFGIFTSYAALPLLSGSLRGDTSSARQLS